MGVDDSCLTDMSRANAPNATLRVLVETNVTSVAQPMKQLN
jgi:hypothetical protein